ncbi:MAG: glycosyltransferase family 9 protein [Alphaproteobacteria bacterium]|nr:glycosyltransferase family 9 protein [Alphaproteobacteria bacterium]
MSAHQEKILVIKLGALGDFIQAMGPMRSIRAHHPHAHITLLTTKAFESFARECGYFDEIWLDTKPRWYNLSGWLALQKKLNSGHFKRAYDLQNNDRSSFYFTLFFPRPEWSGVAKGASHRNISSERTAGHAFDGHAQTLKLAGIESVEIDPLHWVEADISGLGLHAPYALIVPGSAPGNLGKRWPAAAYGELCQKLATQGIQPVLLGTAAEKDVLEDIAARCPQALNLGGKTNLKQIIVLGRTACVAIGNDTGPMHMIAPTGCPCISLFSDHSNRFRHYPKGPDVTVLHAPQLHDLNVEEVYKATLNSRRLHNH